LFLSKLPNHYVRLYTAYLLLAQYLDAHIYVGFKGLAKMVVFVLSPDGTVLHRWVSDNSTVESPYEDIIRIVDELNKKYVK